MGYVLDLQRFGEPSRNHPITRTVTEDPAAELQLRWAAATRQPLASRGTRLSHVL